MSTCANATAGHLVNTPTKLLGNPLHGSFGQDTRVDHRMVIVLADEVLWKL